MPTEIERRRLAFRSLITSLEKKRKSKIFCLIQSEHEHLCAPSLGMLMAERARFTGVETLDVLIHSPGGHIDIAYQTAKFLRQHCKTLNVIVPLYAKSAATLLCLMADNIYMGEFAELGPLDVQIHDPFEKGQFPFSPLDEFKSMEFLREYASEVVTYFSHLIVDLSGMSVKEAVHEAMPAVIQMLSPLYTHIDPSKVGGYRRSLAVGEEYANRVLQQRGFRDPKTLTERLVWGYPSHDFVIDFDEVQSMGLPVRRLEVADEEKLVDSILGLIDLGVSAYGFIQAPTPATKKAAKAKPRKRATKGPMPVPATSVRAAKAGSAA